MRSLELNRNCSALPSWKLAADTITQASGLKNRLSFQSLAVGQHRERTVRRKKDRCGPSGPPQRQAWAQPSPCESSRRRTQGKGMSAAGRGGKGACVPLRRGWEGLSPAGLTVPSLILCPGPPLTNFLPPISPALLLPARPAAPASRLFLPRLTCTGNGNVAFNPNPRANQEGTKPPQDRGDSLRQPRRSVSSFLGQIGCFLSLVIS